MACSNPLVRFIEFETLFAVALHDFFEGRQFNGIAMSFEGNQEVSDLDPTICFQFKTYTFWIVAQNIRKASANLSVFGFVHWGV